MNKLIYLDDAINELKMCLECSEEDIVSKTWNDAIRCAINAIAYHVSPIESEREIGRDK